jgi:hypothetical protein
MYISIASHKRSNESITTSDSDDARVEGTGDWRKCVDLFDLGCVSGQLDRT